MTDATVLVVDGNSLVHRSFHAQAHTGEPAWAVRGLLTQLVAAVDRIRPVGVVVGFDDPERSLRRERWPQYKANRGEKLDTLVEQLADAVATLRELGLAVVVPPGLEADDVLCSTAAVAARAGARTVVVTSDRDAFALIDDTTCVLRIINGGVEASPLMTPDRLVTLLGVRPEQYRDFAALRGDPSDNLPGVRGVGPRTAARLLAAFGTARAAFDDLAAVRTHLGAGVTARLAAPGARAAWELNCQVMTMRDDVEIGLALDAGPGVLPLPAEVVDRVYRSHRLTWSAGQAVRVLAEVDADVPVPTYADAGGDDWFPTGTTAPRRVPRLPRATPRTPSSEQLSLF
ncbi:DNA polymerase-1 [Jatrophihabitans endophyticus]|uniref:5'-3' exonuclease n=1 Tax=Jatrophihabitans endophyticus TaxID=1206085 RepID=A0A1M5MVM0_9ACTN|nr:5'-3' exonuclease H3TH domain-containing protein [Jatrophihabitans endophyticus]SHG81172.1 DNA polymerase-1 [Jatrophihabitans endophyticus]